MSACGPTCRPAGSAGAGDRLARLGLWLRRHRGSILALQWAVVLFYVVVVAWPAFLPLPGEDDHILDNLTRFAQFLFWGIWWPFVILSMMTLGRVWCGLFCPEGALTEWSSKFGLGRPVPRWLKWGGWPFLAFVLTTVFGQMTSVYEYPKPALLILGGSTLAAIAVGLLYGRGKRVWCRHLCPVSGVFGLLARIAPVHFAVDRAAWDGAEEPGAPVSCAPLIDIRRMQSAAACHMCGQCAGQRGAVQLALRSPEQEILRLPDAGPKAEPQDRWPARLLAFGMLGVALGAFQWSASPWFVAAKQMAAEWLIERELWWALDTPGQWWLFTHYPELNDAFTWLDGGLLLAYLGATALVVGGWIWLCLRLAAALAGTHWTRLAMTLIPFAGASVFVGLSLLTTGQLFGEGIVLVWAAPARLTLLALAGLWSASLAWRLAAAGGRRWAAPVGVALAAALPLWAWHQQFFVW
ncbi:MAG: 4Fe-4S binding protein [Thiobacillus sp.]|nr:4Fe-4S binding protein [Thiobacillus sp.]